MLYAQAGGSESLKPMRVSHFISMRLKSAKQGARFRYCRTNGLSENTLALPLVFKGEDMCDNCEYRAECEADENFICPADESDDMWAITQGG